MSMSGESADQIVRMSLEGVEVTAKLAGEGAKQLAVMIYTIMKQQNKTKGKARLANMLRSGKELKVFTVGRQDLQKFCQEAKRYGVLYCVLRDHNKDGIVDVMVRAEDASKINRIFDRFQLATVDVASIKSELEKSKGEKADEASQADPLTPGQEETLDNLLDDLMPEELPGDPQQGEPGAQGKEDGAANPTQAPETEKPLSEPTSKSSVLSDRDTIERGDRPSVRGQLKAIKDSQKEQAAETPPQEKTPPQKIVHKTPKTRQGKTIYKKAKESR